MNINWSQSIQRNPFVFRAYHLITIHTMKSLCVQRVSCEHSQYNEFFLYVQWVTFEHSEYNENAMCSLSIIWSESIKGNLYVFSEYHWNTVQTMKAIEIRWVTFDHSPYSEIWMCSLSIIWSQSILRSLYVFSEHHLTTVHTKKYLCVQ